MNDVPQDWRAALTDIKYQKNLQTKRLAEKLESGQLRKEKERERK